MKRFLCAAVVMVFLGVSLTAEATVTTIPDSALTDSNYYYTDLIGGGLGSQVVMTGGGNAANVGEVRNDDGFRGPISLGFTLNFFGSDYTTFWANNNGNISFTQGLAQFTPSGPQGASVPVISPFFADVDTRNLASGVMWIRQDIPDEVIITWDAVGYFNQKADKLNSFQLVLRGPGYVVPVGEGTIGFFYKTMQWETGDASGGSGGFGGMAAGVGFGNGQSDGVVLESSTANGISSIVDTSHIWFYANLQPVPTPEPTAILLLGSGLLGLWGARKKFKK